MLPGGDEPAAREVCGGEERGGVGEPRELYDRGCVGGGRFDPASASFDVVPLVERGWIVLLEPAERLGEDVVDGVLVAHTDERFQD